MSSRTWNLRSSVCIPAIGLCAVGLVLAGTLDAQVNVGGQAPSLQRRYVEGELVAYRMDGRNDSPQRKIAYQAHVSGDVSKDGNGVFVESLAWDRLVRDGQTVPLSAASLGLREKLSTAPEYSMSVPDLSKVQPMLIGPITDLLTFYADVQLAMRQKGLLHAGDHVYVKHGVPNSWADGYYTLIGQDSIDFDITLDSVNQAAQTARLVVRHVPPVRPEITMPAGWMKNRVGDTENNWVQLQKSQDGTYAAQIGQETFNAEITLSTKTGKILSAHLDNPVKVVERECKDLELVSCGEPIQYEIVRQISLEAETSR